MTSNERAKEVFINGTNCAQAVFLGCTQGTVDERTALMVASCFGGGMSHTDHVCGAMSGGLMAIGAVEGMERIGDVDTKERVAELGTEFVRLFRERFGSTSCTELLSYNLNDPKQAEAAREAGVFETKCPRIVGEAAELVEEILGRRSS